MFSGCPKGSNTPLPVANQNSVACENKLVPVVGVSGQTIKNCEVSALSLAVPIKARSPAPRSSKLDGSGAGMGVPALGLNPLSETRLAPETRLPFVS
jgi:hypothetical protein